ncbi:MAG TPA: AbrB family transcriptional regulator [Alphaproteobacteria bacterium]|jgi:hypothetical protein
MSEFTGFRTRWRRIALGLALGLGAGAVFSWAKTPIPWMIGPLVTIGLVKLLGGKPEVLPYGRQGGQWFIGSAVGIYFTPAVLVALLGYVGWIFLGAILTMVLAALGGLLLARMSGVDRTSCYFATVPGGAAEMSVLAMKYGGNVPAVAISQSLRVSTLVLVIPAVLTYTGFADLDRTAVDMLPPFNVEKFFVLIGITLASAVAFAKLRIQNAWMMGSLISSAVVAASGITLSRVPVEIIDVAQVMLGMALGSRFEREFFLRYKLFIPYALFNGFFLMVACAGVAIGIAWASGLPLGSVLLALAPGGIGEMAITAKGLELGVATVTAFQFVRITAANFSPPVVFPLMRKLGGRWLARSR